MITPRRTRLVRVPDLREFRLAIAASCRPGPLDPANVANPAVRERRVQRTRPTPGDVQRTRPTPGDVAVIIPTRGAARQLEAAVPGATLLTRDELYDHLHARLPDAPRRLTALERDVIAQASARAAAAGESLTFQLRPGLVAEMLRFYDHLRRQSQQVGRFEELILDALGPSGDVDEIDRGARRTRQQTRFLARAFAEYERRVADSAGLDEHLLRERLLSQTPPAPLRHVIVTVADWIADAAGLYVADFDLLSRIPGLERLDVVATEPVLRSGFHERLHTWLPGIEEVDGTSSATLPQRPVLVVRPDAPPDEPWWTHRDREEELVAIVRRVGADPAAGAAVPLERVAVVYKQPLPYLYLAREVFDAAGIPFQTSDALPLAAEPTAAALDLVLDAVSTNFTRGTLIALLRSPHFRLDADDVEVSCESVSALDRALSDARYLGDLERLDTLAAAWTVPAATPALHAALAAARELAPLVRSMPASEAVDRLRTFWVRHLRPIVEGDPHGEREQRARAAVAGTLDALSAVHKVYDDPAWTIEDLELTVRRWIGEQTFDRRSTPAGVHLLDDKAARYGDFDDVTIVGLIDPEWPERSSRNIFYPPALLRSLGWPSEKDRRAAADAHFVDLLACASRRTTLSTFTLDDDALVSRSMQLDDVDRANLVRLTAETAPDTVRLPASAPPSSGGASARPGRGAEREGRKADTTYDDSPWAELRAARSDAADPHFHGVAGPMPGRAWSVSALETYLGCPFRFFAQHVLRLDEEPDDEEVMDPRRQGRFVHEVFEDFFDRWQSAGDSAITAANLEIARAMFEQVVDEALERLPPAEAGLERTRLLGSPAAAGLGEAVMRMEAERPVPVVERLLEHRLEGSFAFATEAGPRTVALNGKADRLDLLADGTFRVIDYKLGWPPDRGTALQLPIYALCAEQRLSGRRGRSWRLGEAAYIAFKGPRRVVPLFRSVEDRAEVLTKAQQRLVDTVDRIAAGEFPPTPDDVYRCETCCYAGVCRKDYVGDV